MTTDEPSGPPAEAQRWLRTARSTARCDRPAAEHAVRAAYLAAGLSPPAVLVWMESPLGGLVVDLALRHRMVAPGPRADVLRRLLAEFSSRLRLLPAEVDTRVRHDGRRQLRRVDAAVRAAGPDADSQVPLQPSAEQWQRARERAREAGGPDGLEALGALRALRFWDGQVARALGHQLRGPYDRALAEDNADQLFDQIFAGISSWSLGRILARDALLHERGGAAGPAPGAALAEAVAALGWWWPTRGAVLLTDRPTTLRTDRDQRLHHADGPALSWADGWSLSSWHGTTVPADLVTGDGWDVPRILTETNAEVRRCAIERMGWERFVAVAQLRPVGPEQPDPGNPGRQLRLYDLPERLRDLYPRPARILLVSNASPDRDGHRRAFGLPVPADVPDALTAVASTFAVDPAEYAGLDRAT